MIDPGATQNVDDLAVVDLRKVAIELADGPEVTRHLEANDFIGQRLDTSQGIR